MSSHLILDRTIFSRRPSAKFDFAIMRQNFIGRNTNCRVDFHHFGKCRVNAVELTKRYKTMVLRMLPSHIAIASSQAPLNRPR
jgi:hypothetical protein